MNPRKEAAYRMLSLIAAVIFVEAFVLSGMCLARKKRNN